MRLAMIVAQAENRVIGRDNKMPWYLPEDLKYFKRTTMGKPIIMGRKTFESIGKPLPGRRNIVVTRDTDWHHEGVVVCATLDEALEQAEAQVLIDDGDEAVVIGGAEIYRQLLARADRLYLTQVHATVEGDACFPEFNADEWVERGRDDFEAVEPNPYPYSFIILDRRGAQA